MLLIHLSVLIIISSKYCYTRITINSSVTIDIVTDQELTYLYFLFFLSLYCSSSFLFEYKSRINLSPPPPYLSSLYNQYPEQGSRELKH